MKLRILLFTVFCAAGVVWLLGGAMAREAKARQLPPGLARATFGGGCFWCMEPPYEKVPGVHSVTSGYAGGSVKNPSYELVSTGMTGHAEVVQIAYDPAKVSFEQLLEVFWRNVDPTDAGGQFCDRGSQYRSAIYTYGEEQARAAAASRDAFDAALKAKGFGKITTEIKPAGEFYYAEDYHQQYLGKDPNGYCGLGGTGVSCPVGALAKA